MGLEVQDEIELLVAIDVPSPQEHRRRIITTGIERHHPLLDGIETEHDREPLSIPALLEFVPGLPNS